MYFNLLIYIASTSVFQALNSSRCDTVLNFMLNQVHASLFSSFYLTIYAHCNDVHHVSNFSPKDIYVLLRPNIRLVMFRIVSTAILSLK